MPVFARLTLLSLLVHCHSTQYTETGLCISKCLCLPNERAIACHENDNMRAIPTNIPKTITRFIVQKGNFDSPILYRHNLTGLEHLTFLKIIYYNLHFIGPKAFLGMNGLLYLDLSHNQLMTLAPFSFSGLALMELHITENVNVKFQTNAFSNMTSETINMRSNNMTDLSYELFQNTKVKSFYLFNNKIATIDSKFQLLFHDPASLLDLSSNPLICDCSLNWLAEVLYARSNWQKTQTQSTRINVTCHRPWQLLDRELMLLRPEDLKCSPLRIDSVNIHLENDTPQLTCVSQIGGTRPPKVKWLYYISDDDKDVITGVSTVQLTNQNTYRTMSITYNTINVTRDLFKTWDSKFACLASDGLGGLDKKLEVHLHKVFKAPTTQTSTATTSSEGSFLFVKHFSILEMFGAVLGTFTVTFLGLVLLLRYLRSYQNKLMNKTDFVDLHRSINSVKPCWYVTHGNSSTYSMPHSYPDYESPDTTDRIADIPCVYASCPTYRSGFLDYKTHTPITL